MVNSNFKVIPIFTVLEKHYGFSKEKLINTDKEKAKLLTRPLLRDSHCKNLVYIL